MWQQRTRIGTALVFLSITGLGDGLGFPVHRQRRLLWQQQAGTGAVVRTSDPSYLHLTTALVGVPRRRS